jgi:O-antigen ligase
MENIQVKTESEQVKTNMFDKIYGIAIFMLSTNAVIPVIRQSLGKEYNSTVGDAFMQKLWLVAYLITVVLIVIRWSKFSKAVFANMWIWLILLCAFLSIGWSASLALTLRRCIALFFTQLIAIYLYSTYGLKGLISLLKWTFSLSIILCFAFSMFLTKIGQHHDGVFDGVWRGIYTHKNSLGQIMLLSTLLWVFSFLNELNASKNKSIISAVFTVLSIILIYKSQSKTSLILIPIILLIVPIFTAVRKNVSLAIGLFFSIVTVGGTVLYYCLGKIEDILVVMGKDITISGRTEIWQLVVDAIKNKPLLGYGYGAFWQGFDGPSSFICSLLQIELPNAHNGYLNITLELGIVGLTLFLLSLLMNIIRILKVQCYFESSLITFVLAFLVYIILFNVTESSITAQNTISWILYCFASVFISCELKAVKVRKLQYVVWGGMEIACAV